MQDVIPIASMVFGKGGSLSFQLLAVVTMNGLTLAALYFIVASGFSLIFGLMRTVNMAHGALYLVGAYAGYTRPRCTTQARDGKRAYFPLCLRSERAGFALTPRLRHGVIRILRKIFNAGGNGGGQVNQHASKIAGDEMALAKWFVAEGQQDWQALGLKCVIHLRGVWHLEVQKHTGGSGAACTPATPARQHDLLTPPGWRTGAAMGSHG